MTRYIISLAIIALVIPASTNLIAQNKKSVKTDNDTTKLEKSISSEVAKLDSNAYNSLDTCIKLRLRGLPEIDADVLKTGAIGLLKNNFYTYYFVKYDLLNKYMGKEQLLKMLEKDVPDYRTIHNITERYAKYLKYYFSVADNLSCIESLPEFQMKEMLEVMLEYQNKLLEKEFVYYNYPSGKPKMIKGVSVLHDNDFLMLARRDFNKDRDYTGGSKIEVMTDYFKMRFFNADWTRRILTYQTIGFGVEAYTPYIRIDDTVKLKENIGVQYLGDGEGYMSPETKQKVEDYLWSKHADDRPYASLQYFYRTIYRQHFRNYIRSKSTIRVGLIGGSLGENIQSRLHKDIVTPSIRALNWDKQIAHGGRLVYNVDHSVDYMLLAPKTESTICRPKGKKFASAPEKKPGWFKNNYLYAKTDLHFGSMLSAAGIGLGFRNCSFGETSGEDDNRYYNKKSAWSKINDGKSCDSDKKGKKFWCETWRRARHIIEDWREDIFFGATYRFDYIIHNSVLEGPGFLKPYKDDPLDDEYPTLYSLDKGSINRRIHNIEFMLGYRYHKFTLQYKMLLHTREYNLPANTDRPWYGWGTIRLNYFI